MIDRRVVVNLAAFVTLFVALGSWAVRNVLELDQIERPYEIVAEFESSPGLQPNVEATYLGTSIGSIDSVRLAEGHVRVVIDVRRGVEIPAGVSAAVRRKSAVGEPYIALDPPATPTSEPARTIDPDEGYTIPLSRTSVPLSYGQLFGSIDDLISSVPPEDLGVVVSELATALEGRGDELRQILASSADLTTTLAASSDVFDQLASDVTRLTRTIAVERDDIGGSFDNLSALTGTLAEGSGDLRRLLDEAPRFGQQVQDLLDATYADLSCSLADVGSLFAAVGTDPHVEDLVRVLRSAAAARDALESSMVAPGEQGADGPYVGGSFGIVQDNPPDAYSPPAALPPSAELVSCAASGSTAPGDIGGAGAVGAGDGAGRHRTNEVEVPTRDAPAEPSVPPSSDAATDTRTLPVIAALLAGALLIAMLLVRSWRRLIAWRKRGAGD